MWVIGSSAATYHYFTFLPSANTFSRKLFVFLLIFKLLEGFWVRDNLAFILKWKCLNKNIFPHCYLATIMYKYHQSTHNIDFSKSQHNNSFSEKCHICNGLTLWHHKDKWGNINLLIDTFTDCATFQIDNKCVQGVLFKNYNSKSLLLRNSAYLIPCLKSQSAFERQ